MSKDLDILGGRDHVRAQIEKHLGLLHDLGKDDTQNLDDLLPDVLKRVQTCWSGISNKYYNRGGTPTLDINNSNQYCQLLLILAQRASKNGHSQLADRIFGLNKMLNGCDIYHEIILPKCFYIDHSPGIVLGRARYGERLYLSQNCTVGSNPGQTEYPVLGSDNFLMSNVTLVGKAKTGDRVIFATGSYAKDVEIPSDSVVFGRSPDITIKPLKPEAFETASPFIQA